MKLTRGMQKAQRRFVEGMLACDRTRRLTCPRLMRSASRFPPKAATVSTAGQDRGITTAGSLLLSALAKFGVARTIYQVFPYGFLDGSQALSLTEELLCKATAGALCKLTVEDTGVLILKT